MHKPAIQQQSPRIARAILSFCLPTNLREAVLGDFEEEFSRKHRHSPIKAKLWYYAHALHNSAVFCYHERGKPMVFLISAVFFILWTILIAALSSHSLWDFINIPSAAYILPPALALAIGSTSLQALKDSAYLSCNDTDINDPYRIAQARLFLQVAAKHSLTIGALAVLLGWISMGLNIEDWSQAGPALAVSLLALMYGIIMKIVFDTAEKRIEGKYCAQ